MRRFLLITALFSPVMAMAQADVTPPPANVKWIPNVYGLYMSQSGEWIGSEAGDASAYNVITGEHIDYWGASWGIGNPISNSGMGVATISGGSIGVVLSDGSINTSTALSSYSFCNPNCVTPDGKRIAGMVNTSGRGSRYVPFYSDIDEAGSFTKVNLLPCPDKDPFGSTPREVTVFWISDDGNTILARMVDARGHMAVPVIYTCDAAGKWNYSLPAEKLFNPNGIVLPPYPSGNGPRAPQPTNYMSTLMKEVYNRDYENWIASGYEPSLYPEPENYMTEDAKKEYNEALAAYNAWQENNKEAENAYYKAMDEILATSPSLNDQEMALSPDGKQFFYHATMLDPVSLDDLGYIYGFNLETGEYKQYKLPAENPFPCKVLSDGTVIATTRGYEVPTSFVLSPGSTEFVPFVDYIRADYPEAAEWIELNFPNGSGVVMMNDDQSIITGALQPGQFLEYDYGYAGSNGFYYSTYVIYKNPIEMNGIESIVSPEEDGVYKVYNLQGVKVMETKDATEINGLAKGIYIVNGKKVAL